MVRPEHLDDDGWGAVESARNRLRLAWQLQDLPEVVGKAKELVETVAKVVVAAADGTLADNADFVPTVKAAQAALKRQPGVDLSQDEALRAITQATQTMATSLGPLCNSYGTGHGRAREPDVSAEMATVTAEAALVWCRWAMRRLGHLLADYPNDLINAVQTGTTRIRCGTSCRQRRLFNNRWRCSTGSVSHSDSSRQAASGTRPRLALSPPSTEGSRRSRSTTGAVSSRAC